MIWANLALFAVSFLVLWLLSPRAKIENARAQNFDNVNFPRSEEGSPVPLVFGKRRIRAPNTIWMDGFEIEAIKETVRTGFFSSEERIIGYKYFLSIALALCLGPGVRLNRIWIEKDNVWSGDTGGSSKIKIDAESLFGGERSGGGFVSDISFYSGENAQAPNAHISSFTSTPGYVGISYLVFEKAYIGNSPSLKAMSFEVSRYSDSIGLGGAARIGEDMNPAAILYELLIMGWGGLDFASNELDGESFKTAGTTLAAEGNGMSLLVSNANDGREVVKEILRQMDAVIFQDPASGLLKLKLIRQDYDVDSITKLNPSNVLEVREYSQSSWGDTMNQVRISFTSRAAKYEQSMAIVQDMANIGAQQRIKSTNISFPHCTTGELASKLASRELSQISVPLYRVSMEVNRAAAIGLVPGDVVSFSWPEYGIVNMLLRIQKMNLGELSDGRVTLDCMQDRFGVITATFAAPEITNHKPITREAVEPENIVVMEPPYWLTQKVTGKQVLPVDAVNKTHLMVMARAGGLNQLGYDAATSQNQVFPPKLKNVGYAKSAKLAADLPLLTGFDGTLFNFLVTNPSEEGWLSVSGTDDDKRAGLNLILVGEELMAFRSATKQVDGSWSIKGVSRGLLDTAITEHKAGEFVYLVDINGFFDTTNLAGDYITDTSVTTFTDSDELNNPVIVRYLPARRFEKPMKPAFAKIANKRTGINLAPKKTYKVQWLPRARVDNSIRLITDTGVTADTGVTYTLRVYAGDVLQPTLTQEGIKTNNVQVLIPADFPAGAGRMEIWAVKQVGTPAAPLESWVPETVYFTVGGVIGLAEEVV